MKYITNIFSLTMVSPAARAAGCTVDVITLSLDQAWLWARTIPAGPQWDAAQAVSLTDAADQFRLRLELPVVHRRQALRLGPGDELLVGLAADGVPYSDTGRIEWALVTIR